MARRTSALERQRILSDESEQYSKPRRKRSKADLKDVLIVSDTDLDAEYIEEEPQEFNFTISKLEYIGDWRNKN